MVVKTSINNDGKLNVFYKDTRIRVNFLELDASDYFKSKVMKGIERILPIVSDFAVIEESNIYIKEISDEYIANILGLDLYHSEESKVIKEIQHLIKTYNRAYKRNFSIEDITRFENEPQIDFSVVLAGPAGVGKSTLIKAFSSYSDEFIYPTINSSRTTLYPTYFYYVNPQKFEKNGIYSFPAYFEFRDENWIRNHLDEYIYKALKRALVIKYSREIDIDIDNIAKELKFSDVMGVFGEITDDQLFLLNLTLGNVNEDEDDIWLNIYDLISDKITLVWESICGKKNRGDLNFNDRSSVINEIEVELKQVEADFIEISSVIFKSIKDEIDTLLGNIKDKDLTYKNEWFNSIEFKYKLKKDNDSNLFSLVDDEIFLNFTSRSASLNFKTITPFIKHARVVLPVNDEILKSIHDFKGFLISDTVGVTHSNNLESGVRDLSVYSHDIILVLDNAINSMGGDVRGLLSSLISNIQVNKVAIGYTHITELEKEDWDYIESSEEYYEKQKEYLVNLQRSSIKEVVDELFDEASRQQYIIDELGKNTIFFEYDVEAKKSGSRKKKIILNREKTVDIYSFLLEMYQGNCRLNESKQSQGIVKLEYVSLEFDETDPLDDQKYIALYSEFRTDFIEYQRRMYIYNYPQYKITEALAKRLSYEYKSYENIYSLAYYGALNLTPGVDCHKFIMDAINKRLNKIKILKKNDLSNKAYYTNLNALKISEQREVWRKVEVVKESMAKQLDKVVYKFFREEKDSFKNAYQFSGKGSDAERRKKILEIFESILPDMNQIYSYSENEKDRLLSWYLEFQRLLKDS